LWHVYPLFSGVFFEIAFFANVIMFSVLYCYLYYKTNRSVVCPVIAHAANKASAAKATKQKISPIGRNERVANAVILAVETVGKPYNIIYNISIN